MLYEVDFAAYANQIVELRRIAWRTETCVPPFIVSSPDDPVDAGARHFVRLHEGRVVAAARLELYASVSEMRGRPWSGHLDPDWPGPLGVLSRLVVHPDHRRLGHADALDQARLSAAQALGCATVVVAVSAGAPRRLLAHGFRPHGRLTADFVDVVTRARVLQRGVLLVWGVVRATAD